MRAFEAAGITVDDLEVHQPSLDDVFFSLTGHPSAPDDEGDADEEMAHAGVEAVHS
jgi:hypothetical protein